MYQTRVRKSLKILDFDIENRPLTYMGNDFTSADVTAIAWSWTHQKKIHCKLIPVHSYEDMLLSFLEAYNEADVVTGHFIRKHDLDHVNGALFEFGLPKLTSKLVQDTYLDTTKGRGLSMSQEAMADLKGVEESKFRMSQYNWRLANRLTPEGVKLTRQRVVDDVRQNKALREQLLTDGQLAPPKIWRPRR
jgi:hypothetical protein